MGHIIEFTIVLQNRIVPFFFLTGTIGEHQGPELFMIVPSFSILRISSSTIFLHPGATLRGGILTGLPEVGILCSIVSVLIRSFSGS